MDKQHIEALLAPKFLKKHVSAALNHFSEMVAKFQEGDWEPCIAKAGKFIEATTKGLALHAGVTFPAGRRFSAGTVIDDLARVPGGTVDDTIRITIPRACRFVYDIANNRGARHDSDEFDPNEMDASAVVPICSWILAELIRYGQKGVLDTTEAKDLVESLSARRYPLIEEVDGRVYFHYAKKSAPDVALLALAYRYPKRMPKKDLIATIQRHGFTVSNAGMAVRNIRKLVDDNGQGQLRLLSPGMKKAEQLMNKAL